MLTFNQIKDLTAYEANPCVSISMPAHRRTDEAQQDPIRFENLVGEAEKQLIAGGMRRPEAKALLERARALIGDRDFWQHQSDGLAMFIAPDRSVALRLPLELPEEVRVGVRFHVKHLLPLIASNGRFYCLAIAQDRVRLYEATRFGFREIEAEEIPRSIERERELTQYQEKVGFHPTGPTPTTFGTPTAQRHAGGEAPEDVRQNQLQEWLRGVANGVDAKLADETAPLVVAADERNLGHFRMYCAYPHAVAEAITQHPESLSEAELHRRAWDLVAPAFARRLKEAEDHFAALAGEGHERALSDVPSVVSAAKFGRVDVLFVADDTQVIGRVDPGTGEGVVGAEADGEDLLDRAAAEAVNTGACVYAMPRDRVPGGGRAAAILRY